MQLFQRAVGIEKVIFLLVFFFYHYNLKSKKRKKKHAQKCSRKACFENGTTCMASEHAQMGAGLGGKATLNLAAPFHSVIMRLMYPATYVTILPHDLL